MLSHTPFICAIYLLLVISTILTIIRPNWLIAWIILEINILRFIPLIIRSKTNQETEASIKYFLSQALGIRIIYQPLTQIISISIIIIAIFIKLGIAPCHFWYPSVIASLSWINCLTLSTWQKLAPLRLLITLRLKSQLATIIIITARINALIGGVIGINQTHLRPLLAYSSIGHIGWIVSILSINKVIYCIIYFIIYTLVVAPIFLIINTANSKTIKSMYNLFKTNATITILIAIRILSLAGIPPLTGFIPKLMVITKLIEYRHVIIVFLLIGALINLYYYLNITFNLLLNVNNLRMNNRRKTNSILPPFIVSSTILMGILPIIL